MAAREGLFVYALAIQLLHAGYQTADEARDPGNGKGKCVHWASVAGIANIRANNGGNASGDGAVSRRV